MRQRVPGAGEEDQGVRRVAERRRRLGQGQASAHDAQQRLRRPALARASLTVLGAEQRAVPLGTHRLGADEDRVDLGPQPAQGAPDPQSS
jgi:hypothetical protein